MRNPSCRNIWGPGHTYGFVIRGKWRGKDIGGGSQLGTENSVPLAFPWQLCSKLHVQQEVGAGLQEWK